jgi:hypothetical protein
MVRSQSLDKMLQNSDRHHDRRGKSDGCGDSIDAIETALGSSFAGLFSVT